MKHKSIKKTIKPDIQLTEIEWMKYIYQECNKSIKNNGRSNQLRN